MAEVKNGHEKEMQCRAASTSVSGCIRLAASAPPLQGSFSSSSLSLPLSLLDHFAFSVCFNPFVMYKTQLLLLIRFDCHVVRLILKINFSCRCFLGSVCSLTFIFNHPLLLPTQFLQLFRFRFASFAFLTPAAVFFLDSSCCFVFAVSHHAVLPPDVLAFVSQTSPSVQLLSPPKTNNDSLGNEEFESVPVNDREAAFFL